MRDKLNNNPMAQIILVGVLVLGAGFFLLTSMGGGGGSSASSSSSTASTTATAAPATGTADASAAGATDASGAAAVTTSAPVVPSPPLPRSVSDAYDANQVVVLLIVRNGGIDDILVARTVHALGGAGGVSTTVVPVQQVARYASITQGVKLDRAPALIVLRPQNLTNGTPQASISYGFLSPQAIVQSVRDATYTGPVETYHPN
jgi:hypothetical protein